MAELVLPIREYIGKSEFNWDTLEFEWATHVDDVRMAVEWAQYDGMEVDSICLEIGICYGGSVNHGLDIYHYLKGLGLPIRTRILSLAASMGTVIPLVGDEIEIEQTAQLLVHGPSHWAGGTVPEMTSGLKQLTDLHTTLRDVYVARTGQPAEVVDAWMSKDTWFTAAEALALGLVTKVLPLAPKTAPVLTETQARARRAKYAGIVARADKRTLRALQQPKPKAAAKKPAATPSPNPMAKNVIPLTPAAGNKAAPLSATQQANHAAVLAFARKLGVKATIEGATEETVVEAVAEATVLAEGAGTLYTDGPLAVDAAVYNDEALTTPTDDGDYEAEDGRVITVGAGIVTAIADAPEETTAPADPAPEALTAAVTAALAPLMARLDSVSAEVDKFKKVVPAAPRPLARAASGSQMDPKSSVPKPAKRGVLAGASTAAE